MIEIRQIIPEGFCLSCSGCCRFAEQGSSWAVHLSVEEQQELGVQDTVLASIPDESAATRFCSYFNVRNSQCSVYYKRPFECRLYPFVINRQGESVFLALDLNCPYAKEKYETALMRDHIAHLSAVCASPVFVRFLKENPWLIQQYPDVLNIAAIPL